MSIRISESDLQKIHNKADKANLTLTEYITKACLGKQIFVVDGLAELTNQYAEMNKLLTDLLDRKRWS